MVGDDLKIRTKKYSLRIIRLCRAVPKTLEGQVIARQLIRSETSVGAPFREGFRAKSKADFVSKMTGALQELDESLYWLELLIEAELMTPVRLGPLCQESNELIAVFVTLVKGKRKAQ